MYSFHTGSEWLCYICDDTWTGHLDLGWGLLIPKIYTAAWCSQSQVLWTHYWLVNLQNSIEIQHVWNRQLNCVKYFADYLFTNHSLVITFGIQRVIWIIVSQEHIILSVSIKFNSIIRLKCVLWWLIFTINSAWWLVVILMRKQQIGFRFNEEYKSS